MQEAVSSSCLTCKAKAGRISCKGFLQNKALFRCWDISSKPSQERAFHHPSHVFLICVWSCYFNYSGSPARMPVSNNYSKSNLHRDWSATSSPASGHAAKPTPVPSCETLSVKMGVTREQKYVVIRLVADFPEQEANHTVQVNKIQNI